MVDRTGDALERLAPDVDTATALAAFGAERRRRRLRRRLALASGAVAATVSVVAIAMVIDRNRADDQDVVTIAEPTSTAEAVVEEPSTTTTPAEAAVARDGEVCDPDLTEFGDAQFAFVGTIVDVREVIHPWDVDPENPERSVTPEPTRWVTFDVDGWYTNDWGTRFSVWMPVHRAVVGERLAVGGDAYHVAIEGFDGQSGEVEFCSPASEPVAESLAAWDAQFGPAIVAGAAQPEGAPTSATLERIDAAEREWLEASGDSYSYLLSIQDRAARPSSCASPTQRVVVVDGAVIEATDLPLPAFACPLDDTADVPSIAELFDLARQVAGATQFDFRSNLGAGTVLEFFASDRSVEIRVQVRGWSASTAPTIVGWDAVTAAADEAADAWSRSPGDRVTHIRVADGGDGLDVTTTERDGEIVDIRGVGITDPSTLEQPWHPTTVDGVFDLIDELTDRGEVAAVFDPLTGAPALVIFDPATNAIDDEITVVIDVTSPSDGAAPEPTSDVEDELRRAGADLAQFPDGLDVLRSAHSCGTLEVAFRGLRGALAPIIRCLSDEVEAGGAAAAVFVTSTVEGDPIVELWLVEDGRATIFVDSSRDTFGGGPFPWTRTECAVELPLPEPVAGYPDATSTFACRD